MSAAKDGLQSRCKLCDRQNRKSYYQDNREKFLAYAKEYGKEHKEDIVARMKIWRKKNSKRLSDYSRAWDKEHKEHVKQRSASYWKEKYANDLSFRIAHNMRCRLKAAIHGCSRPLKYLGCSIEELKNHLEKLFQTGMSWENYGDWHIDHVLPLSGFDLSDPEQVGKACHYTNLQPLWAEDNLRKSNHMELANDNQQRS